MRKEIQSPGSQAQPGEASLLGELPAAEGSAGGLSPAPDSAPADGGGETAGGHPRAGGAAGEGRAAAGGGCGFSARVLIGLIRIYQWTISPLLPNCCRFEPTCSRYAVEALRVHGFWRGSCLTVWRLLRCQPFCRGGWDPVPPRSKPPVPR